MGRTGQRSPEPIRLTLRPRDAAAALGVSERTFRELMRDGQIPFSRLSRAVLIRVADLDRFVEERAQRGGRP